MNRKGQGKFVVAAASLLLVAASSVAWAQSTPPAAPPVAPQEPPPNEPRSHAPYPLPYRYSARPYGYRLPEDDRPEVIQYEEGKPIPPGYTLLRDDPVEKKSVLAPEFLFGPGSAGVRLRF